MSVSNEVIPIKQHESSYIYFSKVIYDWSAFFLATPVRIRYDESRGVYVVRKCSYIQRMACMLAQILCALSAALTLYKAACLLQQHRGSLLAYFDMLNKIILSAGIYVHVYVHWYRLDLVEAYVDAIQTNPVAQYCRTPPWVPVVGSCFTCTVIMYLSFTWLKLVIGVNTSSWDGFRLSVEGNAREMFWWYRNEAIAPPVLLCVATLMGQVLDSYFCHVPLVAFTAWPLCGVYFIISDFFNAMLEGAIPVKQALELFYEYAKLMKKANAYLGLYLLQYVVMTMTYHAIHLFDLLNSTNTMWQISTFLYLVYIISFYFVLARIYVETKKMRKWLWNDQSYLKIPYPQLVSILYDLEPFNYKFGVRMGDFTVTAAYSGGTLARTISYSMLIRLAELQAQSGLSSK